MRSPTVGADCRHIHQTAVGLSGSGRPPSGEDGRLTSGTRATGSHLTAGGPTCLHYPVRGMGGDRMVVEGPEESASFLRTLGAAAE